MVEQHVELVARQGRHVFRWSLGILLQERQYLLAGDVEVLRHFMPTVFLHHISNSLLVVVLRQEDQPLRKLPVRDGQDDRALSDRAKDVFGGEGQVQYFDGRGMRQSAHAFPCLRGTSAVKTSSFAPRPILRAATSKPIFSCGLAAKGKQASGSPLRLMNFHLPEHGLIRLVGNRARQCALQAFGPCAPWPGTQILGRYTRRGRLFPLVVERNLPLRASDHAD